VEREFSISFDEYFAPELERLEEPRAEGLVILARVKFASPRSGAFSFATWPWLSTATCTNSRWTSGRCSRKHSERTRHGRNQHVVVIGGGISGLACAYRLQQLGVR
jgi:NADPH-dependent 2,4-dienoyl-CoA reductase/sulfur reductase-like enzyme